MFCQTIKLGPSSCFYRCSVNPYKVNHDQIEIKKPMIFILQISIGATTNQADLC